MWMAENTELELELLLPDVNHSQDGCVQRLTDMMVARKGVDRVHHRVPPDAGPGRIWIQFDPAQISAGELRQFAMQSGASLSQRYGHLLRKTQAMSSGQARELKARLESTSGVLDAGVSPDGVLRLEFDKQLTRLAEIERRLVELGVHSDTPPARLPHHQGCGHGHGGVLGEHTDLVFALLSGVCLVASWSLGAFTDLSPWISWALYAGSYALGGFFIVREAIEKTLRGRFEIDFLMIVAAAGAAILGHWAEGALLLFLFSLGHALEHYAMGRARKAIEALSDLAPDTAWVRRHGEMQRIPVEDLRVGDEVIVRTHERIAADGFVIQGESSVDQSPITGESLPADKHPVVDRAAAAANPEKLNAAHRVFAGTINQAGSLEIQVTRLAAESTLSRVVTMVSEAETQTSPTQQFTDRFERYFVPAVLGVVILLHFAFLVVDESFADSFYRAMAVLVAASPCALAISTPSAVLSGIARAARGGVLVKGGGPLENLGRLSAIAFDKTGTLTAGQPRLTHAEVWQDATQRELLTSAVAVEQLSDHPLAAAVVRDGLEWLQEAEIPVARSLQSMTGRGIRADVAGQPVTIGKLALFEEQDHAAVPPPLQQMVRALEKQGRTTMLVQRGQQFLGVLGLMDTPRDSAKKTVAELRRMGVQRMIMISGDNQYVADAVAQEVGIDEAWGDLMPADKVQAIRNLREQHGVAMVGDGVNDAPAMANANVGIAMGAAGSDVALETADIALMADDLSRLPFAVGLSRQTSRIIRQNVWFSLGMVAILVPSTILGLRLGLAVVFHEGSTIAVVLNALRLLVYRQEP